MKVKYVVQHRIEDVDIFIEELHRLMFDRAKQLTDEQRLQAVGPMYEILKFNVDRRKDD
jgi:hypothetical protein